MELLHLIAGISYYKAAVPEEIGLDGGPLDPAVARLVTAIYENGLGEFAYCNGLNLHGRIRFPAADTKPSPSRAGWDGDGVEPTPTSGEHHPHPIPPPEGEGDRRRSPEGEGDRQRSPEGEEWRQERFPAEGGSAPRALVAIGGGKDSLVSIEALRAAGVAQTVAWIGASPLIAACAAHTGLPTLNIERRLAPELFEFNRQGAWNGHIPVTAINSAILVLAAVLHGFEQVVFSNERSASYGSLIPGAGEVNHQWSKGWVFERAFGEHVTTRVAPGLRYYSLLRPLSELAVARQFARLERYDRHFSSCNRNFHLLGERPASRWCGQCPKCRFVFLALAPFMPKPRLTAIFGRNLLDELEQQAGYDALIEYRDSKPFECVGEAQESRAAFAVLVEAPAWREDALVARFAREIAPRLGAVPTLSELLAPAGEHRVPAAIWNRVDAYFRA